METVSVKTQDVPSMQIKARRTLKGHQTKILCLDWANDGQHLVSSSQVSDFSLNLDIFCKEILLFIHYLDLHCTFFLFIVVEESEPVLFSE